MRDGVGDSRLLMYYNYHRRKKAFAPVVELVDTLVLEASLRVRVRVSLGAPNNTAFVQWIGHESSKLRIEVRFLYAVP